jgi:hypothetical protein
MNLMDLIKEYRRQEAKIRLIFLVGSTADITYFEGVVTEVHEDYFSFKYTEAFKKETSNTDDDGNIYARATVMHFFETDFADLWRIEEFE